MRIVMFSYAGNIGIRCFEWLVEQGEEVIAVVTRPGEPGEVRALLLGGYFVCSISFEDEKKE